LAINGLIIKRRLASKHRFVLLIARLLLQKPVAETLHVPDLPKSESISDFVCNTLFDAI
jgi:hypothetical protein